ncbi:hypothetical protein [Nocardioides sp.]|uniref:hypothetical protein n=1 Tax=Nocardioides sp. TaxID=35761 RepID=UPI00272772FA|nr:hypothetical protein [Nocardioides sp.]MDO9456015.1 hypothetical protein [Nocardioides sp.]
MSQRLDRLAGRYGRPIDVHRAQARVSAYVYGNILVLAAVVAETPHAVEEGHAAFLVVATTVTTFLAHVLAHAVGGVVGQDLTTPRPRGAGREDLRDAQPILSSGVLPAAILAAAWLLELKPELALVLASVTVVLRLAGMGLVVARLSGRAPAPRQLYAGILLAAVSVVVVALKVTLTH